MNRIKFDKKLFALIILLFIIGVIFVYSAFGHTLKDLTMQVIILQKNN